MCLRGKPVVAGIAFETTPAESCKCFHNVTLAVLQTTVSPSVAAQGRHLSRRAVTFRGIVGRSTVLAAAFSSPFHSVFPGGRFVVTSLLSTEFSETISSRETVTFVLLQERASRLNKPEPQPRLLGWVAKLMHLLRLSHLLAPRNRPMVILLGGQTFHTNHHLNESEAI